MALVVYTQEYPVARKLQEEARLVEQEYIAEVSGSLDAEGLAWLRRGLPYDGLPASPMQVSWQNETRLRFALKTPAPGFIEYACDAAGLELRALRRIRIGRLPLAACRPMARAPGLRALLRPTRSAEQPTYSRSTPDRCRTIPSRQRAEVFKQAGMLGLAALTLAGARPGHRRVRSSGGRKRPCPRRARLCRPLRPAWHRRAASAAPNAADDAADWLLSRGYQPRIMPAARSRLDTPFDYLAGTRSAGRPARGLHFRRYRCRLVPAGRFRLLAPAGPAGLRTAAPPRQAFIGYSDIAASGHPAPCGLRDLPWPDAGAGSAERARGTHRVRPLRHGRRPDGAGRLDRRAGLCLADDADARHGHRPAGGRQPGADLRHAGLAPRDRHARRHPVHRGRRAARRVMLSQLAAAGKFESIAAAVGSFIAQARATMRSSSTRSIPCCASFWPAGHSRAGRLAQWPRRSEP